MVLKVTMEKKWLLFIPVVIVYFIGMFIDVMDVDAAQYAAMSLEMFKTGNYLEVYYGGLDYIDKPPLIFWASAWMYHLIGVSTFAYKLPSVLFSLLGLYATYRLGKLLYNERAGFYAALILGSCYAWFNINQDVRTDTLLAACTVGAIWQLMTFTRTGKRIHILYGALGIAGAMLTKGPIGIMVPALAMGTDFLLRRQWKLIFRWEWLMMLAFVLLFLSPMLYGLYTQFDQAGGKDTFNYGDIDSGIMFYFWTQSFGRLTGESTWRNDSDAFFFAHTFLWAFLPWSLLFVFALIHKVKDIWKKKFFLPLRSEAITFGGTLLPAIAFSLSQYKLPHYIFVFFPLAAILAGKYLSNIIRLGQRFRYFKSITIVHVVVSLLLLLIIGIFGWWSFPMHNVLVIVVTTIGTAAIIYYAFSKGSPHQKLFLPCFIAIVTLNFVFNAHFYPQVLAYQSGSQASRKVLARDDHFPFVIYRYAYYSADFYYGSIARRFDSTETLAHEYSGRNVWILTDQIGYDELKQSEIELLEVEAINDFHVTTLNTKFLNPKTRAEAVDSRFLILVSIR